MNKLCGYEGGYSPDLYSPAGNAINTLRSASSYSDKVGKYNLQSYINFYGLSDGSFTAHFGSNYLMSGTITPDDAGVIRYGSVWMMLQDIYMQPRPSQWKSMMLINKGTATALTVRN